MSLPVYHMENQKKELAANISETIHGKLTDSANKDGKLMKAINKTAKNLAELVIKMSVKQEKKVKKLKDAGGAIISEKKPKKQKKEAGQKRTHKTERESLRAEKI